jgi:hypothetical protein
MQFSLWQAKLFAGFLPLGKWRERHRSNHAVARHCNSQLVAAANLHYIRGGLWRSTDQLRNGRQD